MPSEEPLPDVPELVFPKLDFAPHPYDIALIIDDTVFQIMNVDGQSAAQFLSQPKFVRITGGDFVKVGWKYIDGQFVQPDPNEFEFPPGV